MTPTRYRAAKGLTLMCGGSRITHETPVALQSTPEVRERVRAGDLVAEKATDADAATRSRGDR